MLRHLAIAGCLIAAGGCKDKPVEPPKPAAPPVAPPKRVAPVTPTERPAVPDPDPAPPDDLERKPTPDEIDRCAKLYILAAACGQAYDPELGWVQATHATRLGDNVARRACAVDHVATAEGPQMPMPRFPADALARLDAAFQAGGCQPFVAELARHAAAP